jgi:hypothetical protein
MRPHTRRSLLALFLLALPLGGCGIILGGAAVGGALGAATAPPPPDAGSGPWQENLAFMVDFTPPREVVASKPGARADVVRMGDATRVIGRAHRVAGDTVWLVLSEIRGVRAGALTFPRGREPVMLLVADGSMRPRAITPRSATTRSLLGAGSGAIVAIIGFLAYLVVWERLN